MAAFLAVLLSSHTSTPPIKLMINQEVIQTEIDGTMVIPLPSGVPYRNILGIYRSTTTITPFIQIDTPGRLRRPAAAYYGAFGTNRSVIFVYPPDTGADWRIELEGNHTTQIVLGRFHLLLRSQIYIWELPYFIRVKSDYPQFKNAVLSTIPGTKIYRKYGSFDYIEVGIFVGSPTSSLAGSSNHLSAFDIQFTNGRIERYSATQLTNFFVSPE